MRDPRATVFGNPVEERPAVQVDAVTVEAVERTVYRLVAGLDDAVRVCGAVRADDGQPALTVRLGQDQTLVVQPLQDRVLAGVAQGDRLNVAAVLLARRDPKSLANLIQGVFPLRVELDQARRKQVAPRLEVDRPRQTEVADGVRGAWVRVARLGYGADGGSKPTLGGLVAETVTPLKTPRRRLHDPRRCQRRGLGLGADVVQHHNQDEVAIVSGCR